MSGPIFISVGKPAQLAKFIELNPELAPFPALVDDSPTFEGYRSAGFNYLMGDKPLESMPEMQAPKEMGFGKSLSYARNVMTLSPVPDNMKFGDIPPGVKVIGGTYAINDDAVVFSHQDPVPGATPDIEEVLAAVGA